jgi:hypothetical protein
MDFYVREILDYNISYHMQFLSEFGVYHKMTMNILIKSLVNTIVGI